MTPKLYTQNIPSILFGFIVIIVGILNLVLVHPVPACAYFLLSLIYFPFVNNWLQKRLSLRIHSSLKIVLAIIIFLFTLGVSDLGDILDDWFK